MYIRAPQAAIIYRCLLVIAAGYGLADGFGLLAGALAIHQFAYFTDVSNILCLLYYLAAIADAVVRWRRSAGPRIFLPRVKGAVTLSISLTLLVNHFVLHGTPFIMIDGHLDMANLLAHYLVPIMVICDFMLFDPKGCVRPVDPILYALIPLIYLLYTFVRAAIGGPLPDGQHYPYPFLDASAFGAAAVTRNIALLAVGFFGVGYGGYVLDRILAANNRGCAE